MQTDNTRQKKRKMPIFTILFLLIIISVLVLESCKNREPQPAQTYNDLIFSVMKFAVEAGGLYGEIARDIFKATYVEEFITAEEMMKALRKNVVDAILISEEFVLHLHGSDFLHEFEYILVPPEIYVNKAAPIFHTTELRDKYNEWFATAVEDGTWSEVIDRWLIGHIPALEDIPQFDFKGTKGVIRVVDTGNYPPLSYMIDDKLVGFDADMANRFILSLDMQPEYIIVPYEEAAQYVLSGRADMSACTYAISDTREGKMIFGEPSVITPIVLMVKK